MSINLLNIFNNAELKKETGKTTANIIDLA